MGATLTPPEFSVKITDTRKVQGLLEIANEFVSWKDNIHFNMYIGTVLTREAGKSGTGNDLIILSVSICGIKLL